MLSGTQKPITKRQHACSYCRVKKIRCSGGSPCSNCCDHGENCAYPPKRRSRQKSKSNDLAAIAQRLTHFESLLGSALDTSTTSHDVAETAQDVTVQAQTAIARVEALQPDVAVAPHAIFSPRRQTSQLETRPRANEVLSSKERVPSAPSDHRLYEEITGPTSLIGPVLDAPDGEANGRPLAQSQWQAVRKSSEYNSLNAGHQTTSSTPRKETSSKDSSSLSANYTEGNMLSAATSSLEYQGPKSWMSICSRSGIDWVNDKVQSLDFEHIAARLSQELTKNLNLDRRPSTLRGSEPTYDEALQYTKAYFEEAPDIAYGMRRSWFEAKLHTHFNDSSLDENDPAWYALRNIIYAFGCRISRSKVATCRETAQASWTFFANALSVHTELLYWRTSVLGVQALTLMAFFTEAISSPTLQYMLCSSAMRLACAKGMHRQSVSSWGIPQEEETLRNCTFWKLYCLEKQIASRSGRPPSIDDDEISCEIPSDFPGSPSTAFCIATIQLGRMSSAVAKKLSSAQAFRRTTEEIVTTVSDLDEELKSLTRSMQQELGVKLPMDLSNPPEGLNLHSALVLQSLYYGIVFDIHTALTYPWSGGTPKLQALRTFRQRIEASIDTVAKTCRAIILDCRFIHIDANCPLLYSIHIPLYAIISLFIHILRDPGLTSVQSDLSLLEVAAGHFARLEFVTESQVSTPFARDMAQLARTAVANRAQPHVQQTVQSTALGADQNAFSSPSAPAESDLLSDPLMIDGIDLENWYGMLYDDNTNSIEKWSIMLPGVDHENYPRDSFIS